MKVAGAAQRGHDGRELDRFGAGAHEHCDVM